MSGSLIRAADVRMTRAAAGWLLSDVCSITDPGSVVSTDDGGTSIENPVTTSGVACMFSSTGAAAAQREFGAQLVAETDFLLTLAPGTAIREGWTVTDAAGVTYVVRAVAEGSALDATTRALVTDVRNIGG
jgi:hypothetical protein